MRAIPVGSEWTCPPERRGPAASRADQRAGLGAALRSELKSPPAFARRLLTDRPQTAPGVLWPDCAKRAFCTCWAEEAFRALKGGSRRDPAAAFLQEMRELGHVAADSGWQRTSLSSESADGEACRTRSLTHEACGPGANVVALAQIVREVR